MGPALTLRQCEPLAPAMLMVLSLGLWLTLLLSQGPMVLAITLFSPVSSSAIFIIIGLALWIRSALRRAARRAIESALLLRACPACGQSLQGVPTREPATPCPECGSSWDLSTPDPHRPRPPIVIKADPTPHTPGNNRP